jgi:hypothetical protein
VMATVHNLSSKYPLLSKLSLRAAMMVRMVARVGGSL